jgi:hypothetical protein
MSPRAMARSRVGSSGQGKRGDPRREARGQKCEGVRDAMMYLPAEPVEQSERKRKEAASAAPATVRSAAA